MSLPAKKPLLAVDASRLLWAGAVGLVVGAIIWGGMQSNDPLAAYIHTDKMRHVIGFGALGLLAPFRSSAQGRMAALLAAFGVGLAVELIQGVLPDRNMSLKDLMASCVGVLAGYGAGSVVLTARQLLRERLGSRPASGASQRS